MAQQEGDMRLQHPSARATSVTSNIFVLSVSLAITAIHKRELHVGTHLIQQCFT